MIVINSVAYWICKRKVKLDSTLGESASPNKTVPVADQMRSSKEIHKIMFEWIMEHYLKFRYEKGVCKIGAAFGYSQVKTVS